MSGLGLGGRRGSSRLAAVATLALAACGGAGDVDSRVGPAGSPTDIPAASGSAPPPAPTPPAPTPPTPSPEVEAADPVGVVIPAIGVDAPVIALGLDPSGALEVPAGPAETGWWRAGPEPGEVGPAVIVGHVDSASGPAVFYRLGELRPGDEVEVVRADGSRVGFVVGRVEQHPKDAFPTAAVYDATSGAELRLVTCGGEFDRSSGHYVDNVVVYASGA